LETKNELRNEIKRLKEELAETEQKNRELWKFAWGLVEKIDTLIETSEEAKELRKYFMERLK
jgi:uncharacterized coiled-coil DUF342 family protein